jgi:hypothetical protein
MTHTLHRTGDIENLREDYIMLIMPSKNVNIEGSREKINQIWDLLSKYKKDLVNFGNGKEESTHQTDPAGLKDTETRIIHVVFKEGEVLKSCLQEIKERNFGLSVVISGIYEEVNKLCEEIGLSPHTVGYSLGFHGNRERLPDKNVLEITTMCGHALVSKNLVSHMVRELESGRVTYEEAAQGLSKGCICGIFNTFKAEKVLRTLVSK